MRDDLEANASDQLVAITKGATSLIPLVGGLLGEIVGTVIPNQRADRIVAYLRQLETRLGSFDQRERERIAFDPGRIEMIEEGGYQAARATSKERIDRIVEAVTSGLKSDEADVIRRKRLLVLLGQIDDDEMALLNAYGQSYGGDGEAAWEKVNRPSPAHMGSSADEVDREKLFEAGRDNLLRLGLLEKKYSVKRGETPEFDNHRGDFKHRVEVSYLGRLLLREVGMPSPFDDVE